MPDEIQWDGSELVGLERSLRATPRLVKQAVGKQIKNGGRRIGKRARVLAPKRSGTGAKSITANYSETEFEMKSEIGPTVYYMRFQEHGTAKMPAHSYLAPALDAEVRGIDKKIADAAGKTLEG